MKFITSRSNLLGNHRSVSNELLQFRVVLYLLNTTVLCEGFKSTQRHILFDRLIKIEDSLTLPSRNADSSIINLTWDERQHLNIIAQLQI